MISVFNNTLLELSKGSAPPPPISVELKLQFKQQTWIQQRVRGIVGVFMVSCFLKIQGLFPRQQMPYTVARGSGVGASVPLLKMIWFQGPAWLKLVEVGIG